MRRPTVSFEMDLHHWIKVLLLFCCLGVAVRAEYGWRPRLDYRFALEGRNLAGITILNNQFTGIHYRGILNIQSQSSNVLNVALYNMSYVKLQKELENGWWDSSPSREDDYMSLPITDKAFTVRLNKGTVQDLVVSRDLADWEVNFIQGIVSKLQLDVSGSNIVKGHKGNAIPGRSKKTPDVFSVMEDGVTGRCEVMYEISKIPRPSDEVSQQLCGSRPFLEITKTQNHSNCEVNPEYHFGLPHTLQCQPGGNQCGEFWTRSTVSRTIGCGSSEDMVFLSSTTSSRIVANLNLHNNSQASVNSYLNITLLSTLPLSRKLPLPESTKTIHNLLYKYTSPDIEESSEEDAKTADKKHFDSSGSAEETTPEPKQKKRLKKTKPHFATSPKKHHQPTPEKSSAEKGLWNLRPKEHLLPPPRPFDGFALAHRKIEDRACLSQQLKEMVTDIANDLEGWELDIQQSTLEKILLAIRVCRSMTYSDLVKTIGIHMNAQVRDNKLLMTERKVFRDIITACGTNPAFEIAKSWIEEKKLTTDEAISIISYLPSHLISPNMYTIDQYYELLRSSAVKNDINLKSAALLAFSNLVRVACISRTERQMRYPYHVEGEPCNALAAANYISYLTSQLRGDPTLRPVVYVALGNTASLLALPPLTSAANDPASTPYLRSRAIIAMKHLVLREPRTLMPVLLSIFDNKQNPELVRLSAISMLFFTKPPLTVWQRIATGTWYEPSASIQTFIYTTIKTFSESTDPKMEEIARNAAAVLKLVKTSRAPLFHHARNSVHSSSLDEMQKLMSRQFSLSNSIYGANLYQRHISRIAGFSRVGVESDLWLANKNGFYQGLIALFYPKEDPMIARPPLENLAHSTRWIKETLKIVPRTGPKLEGDFNIRFNRLIERMILFNKGTFAELSKYGKRLMEDIKKGKPIHKQSIDNIEFEMAVITDTGFPVSFRVDNPTLLNVVGALSWTNNKTRQFNADISITYASNLQAELSFYTPFDNTQHVAAHYSQRIVKPPATRLHAGLNSQGDGLVVSMWPLKAIDKPLSIYKEINKPFTAQRDVNHFSTSGMSKNSHAVHGTYVIDKEDTSMPLKLTMHRDVYDNTKMRLDSTRPFSIFALPSVWPDLAASTIEYTLDGYYPTTLEIGMGRSYTRGGEVRMVKPQQMNGFRDLTKDPNSPSDTTTYSTTESSTITTSSPSDITTTETTPYNENITTTESSTSTDTPTPSSTMTSTMSTMMSTQSSTFFPTTMPTTMSTTTPSTTSTSEDTYNGMIAPGSEEVIRFCKWAQQPQNDNFNASTMNLAEINDSHERVQYLLRRILDGIECGNAFAGGLTATFDTPEPKKYGVYWGIGNEISNRVHRVGVFLLTPDEEKSNYGLTATLSSNPMPVLYLSDILRSNINSNLYADLTIPGKDAYTIKGYMLRSAPKPSFYDTEPVRGLLENHYSLIPESRQIARDYTTLDVYNFTFFTNEIHQIGNSYPVRMLKRLYYPHINEEPATGVNIGGRANIAVTVCPESDCLDALMRLPGINVRFDQIPVNPTLFSMLQVNPVFGPMSSLVDPSFCSLELGNIVTFDGTKFGWNDYDSRQCWHVLAKDCSGASRIAILARIYNNYTEVEVNLDNYRVLRLKNGPTAEVNGETIAMSEDLVAEVSDLKNATLMVISKSKDQAIEVRMPAHGFYLIYGDDRVMVEASRIHQGRLCGLCGDYDGEKVNDFRKAGGDVVASSNEFSLSYAFLRSCERNNHTQ